MPSRISGKLGRVYISPNEAAIDLDTFPPVSLLFDWTLEFQLEAAECSVKGEIAEKYCYGTFTGRITARRFSSDAPNDSVLARALITAAGTAGGAMGGVPILYVLKQVVGAGIGQQIAGSGYVTRGQLTSPRQMAEDSFEIVLNSIPTLTSNSN